jgi:SAM-dependent methyltransferase
MKHSTHFGEAKKEYVQFRPQYPSSLFETIIKNTPCPYLKAVDLGAGTGISTIILSKYFNLVYAVEPDRDMIKEVKFPNNVNVLICTAEDFNCDNKEIELITAGNAFYWMDGEIVAGKAEKFLRKEGVLAAYRYNFPKALSNSQEIFEYELKNHWNAFRNERLIDTEYTYRTIKNVQLFSKVDLSYVSNVQSLTPESLVGFFTSTSYGSAYIKTLEKKEHYVANLIESVKKLVNQKTIEVDFGLELVLAVK